MNFETPIGVSFPDVSVDQTRTLRGHIMAIQRGLRNEVTKRISDYTKIESPQLALGMDSLHAGPCVYWVGKNPCKDDIGGQCSACGYNRVVFPEEGVDEESFLRQQFQAYQVEMDAWIKDGADKKFVLVTGFIGSFFSDYEVSPALRKELLEWLRDDFKERKVEPQVYIEARAEDVIAVGKGGELDELLPLLKNLNARVILGLESRNDFIRTVVFAKQLRIESFEKAARLLQERQIGVNAFVFMGNHSMGEQETFDDVSAVPGRRDSGSRRNIRHRRPSRRRPARRQPFRGLPFRRYGRSCRFSDNQTPSLFAPHCPERLSTRIARPKQVI